MYTQPISESSKACVLVLLDQSISMQEPIRGSSQRKCDVLANRGDTGGPAIRLGELPPILIRTLGAVGKFQGDAHDFSFSDSVGFCASRAPQAQSP